jgi:hypothetical protein
MSDSTGEGWLTDYFDMVCCICLPKRREHMREVFRRLECEPLWVNPVMKDTIDTSDENVVVPGAGLRTGQIACHLSHLKALKMLTAHRTAQTVLVFEDDLAMPSRRNLIRMRRAVHEMCRELPAAWEVLYLGKCWETCTLSAPVGNHLLRTRSALCRHAIAFTKTGADKVIRKTLPMYNAGDRMIAGMLGSGELEGYSMRVPIFYQNRERWGSTLGNYTVFGVPTCAEDVGIPFTASLALLVGLVVLCKVHLAKR